MPNRCGVLTANRRSYILRIRISFCESSPSAKIDGRRASGARETMLRGRLHVPQGRAQANIGPINLRTTRALEIGRPCYERVNCRLPEANRAQLTLRAPDPRARSWTEHRARLETASAPQKRSPGIDLVRAARELPNCSKSSAGVWELLSRMGRLGSSAGFGRDERRTKGGRRVPRTQMFAGRAREFFEKLGLWCESFWAPHHVCLQRRPRNQFPGRSGIQVGGFQADPCPCPPLATRRHANAPLVEEAELAAAAVSAALAGGVSPVVARFRFACRLLGPSGPKPGTIPEPTRNQPRPSGLFRLTCARKGPPEC